MKQSSSAWMGGEEGVYSEKVNCGDAISDKVEFGLISACPIGWPETFALCCFPVCSRILCHGKIGNNYSNVRFSLPLNPRDGRAWWAAVFWVTWSRTRLKRLSSSSSSPIYTFLPSFPTPYFSFFIQVFPLNDGHLQILFIVFSEEKHCHLFEDMDQAFYRKYPHI